MFLVAWKFPGESKKSAFVATNVKHHGASPWHPGKTEKALL